MTADPSPSLPGPDAAYYEALGRFIHQFAAVERLMHDLLTYVAEVSFPSSRAMFSGTRTSEAMNIINRLCDAKGLEERKERLKPAFDQLGVITTARNDILHYGAYSSEDGTLIVETHQLAYTPDRLRRRLVSVVILNEMTDDLIKIQRHIQWDVWGEHVDEAGKAFFMTWLSQPWLYKYERPTPHPKNYPSPPRKQKRQRPASQK